MKILPLLLLCTLTPTVALDLTDEDKNKALEGEIVAKVIENKNGVGIQALFVIRSPIEQVWALMNDMGFYHKVYPEYQKIALIEETPGSRTIEYEMRIAFATLRYTLRREYPSDFTFTWKLVKGDLKRIEGKYELMALGSTMTILQYESFIETKYRIVDLIKNLRAIEEAKKAIRRFIVAAESAP